MLPAPAPELNAETERFWTAAGGGRLELPRCARCGLLVFYPRAVCPDCQSTELEWETLSGRGTVYSYTVMRSGASRRWRDHLPYIVAYVRLDEGPTVLTNVVNCDPEAVHIDMAVRAVFDDTGEGTALLRFEPVHELAPHP